MSDTLSAVVRRLREESPTIDAVSRQLQRQVDPKESESVVAFAEIFLARATKEFLLGRSPETLAHITLGAWRFLQESEPDKVQVEVFNPEVENEGWHAPVTVLRTNISERPFIVDSLREFLHEEGLSIEHLIYPVMHVERNGKVKSSAYNPHRTVTAENPSCTVRSRGSWTRRRGKHSGARRADASRM